MKKKKMILLIVCLVLMFGWIFLAVALTGGREPADFTRRDWQVMIGFGLAELLTLIVLFVTADKLGKQRAATIPEAVNLTRAEKARKRTGAFLTWGALLLALAAEIVGILLWKGNDALVTAGDKRACGLGYLVGLVVLPLASFGASKLYERKFTQMSAREANQFVQSHRDQAEETARQKLRELETIRRIANVYGLLLFFLGMALAFASGYLYQSDDLTVPRLFGAALIIGGALQQLVIPVPKGFLEEMDGRLSEADYPELYGLVRQAAQEGGWQGPVMLFIAPFSGAVIGTVREVACIRLGALTLGTMTKEELHAIFAHEFAHMGAENRRTNREADYYGFLSQGRNPNAVSIFTTLYYGYLDCRYALAHELYTYAAALGIESRADQAMAGNPQAAAASLLKLKYYELYLWERDAKDCPPDWQPETVPEHLSAQSTEDFRKVFAARREDWEKLIKAEIPARSATHPTTWQRIQALGLEQLPTVDLRPQGELARECARAVDQLDGQTAGKLADGWQDARREKYLEPMERLNAWEEAGCPLTAEGYADLEADLRTLNRQSDSLALCDRAIRELPEAAACYAHFIRGCHRLHRYDKAGLEDLYTAIQGNSNYVDEALEQIGTFCCLVGLQEELEVYREKAVDLAQRQKDEFNQLLELKRGDQLSREQLPKGMLEGILSYIAGISQDSIEKIFLVHKTITQDFFTSVFVIWFLPETPEDIRQDVMHKIFCYLDSTTDWQFSLFAKEEVPKGMVERVEGSCVFERQ